MTEVSKEAVEALIRAVQNVDETIELDLIDATAIAFELKSQGFTIAPIAPVTDEKLREAVARLREDVSRKHPETDADFALVESALSELAQRRAEEINLKADNARIRELAECYNNEIEQWQKRYMALAESTLKVNAIPSIMMPLPTPPKED